MQYVSCSFRTWLFVFVIDRSKDMPIRTIHWSQSWFVCAFRDVMIYVGRMMQVRVTRLLVFANQPVSANTYFETSIDSAFELIAGLRRERCQEGLMWDFEAMNYSDISIIASYRRYLYYAYVND